MSNVDCLEKIKVNLLQECSDIKDSVIHCSDYKQEEYQYMRGVHTGIETAIEMINEYLNVTVPAEKELEQIKKKELDKQKLFNFMESKKA
jgi:hypothetical protein